MSVNSVTFVAPNLAWGKARGASARAPRSIPRQWGCDRRATKLQAKFGATLRAAVLFGPGDLARSLQIHWGDMLWCPCGSTSRLAWAENSSPQTSPDLHPLPLSEGRFFRTAHHKRVPAGGLNSRAKTKAMNALKFSTVLALLIFTEIGRADPMDTWTWRNPLPTGNRLHSITHGSGQFVAVGSAGTIITSAEGTNWVLRQAPTQN